MPGVQYRFMVTAVGPSGRLGETVASSWTEINNSTAIKTLEGLVTLRNGYNNEKGVTAHDSSPSVLMPHLEFQAAYTISIVPTSAEKTQLSKPLLANFKSLQCKDVHGQGSIQCVPEPVLNLSVVLRPNGTGVVSWIPSADQENILFYQLIYYALRHESGCQVRQETVNIRAVASSVTVDFPGQKCEYVVRLVNYD
ncbi:unnamed protein product, partial [Strongylus vulgaris]